MHIGFYSSRPEILRQMRSITEEFNEMAYLDLLLHSYTGYPELLHDLTDTALDVLLYDMDGDLETETQILRIKQTIPNCQLVLLSDSEKHALFGYGIHAAGYLLTPLDTEDFLSVLIYLIRQHSQISYRFLPVKIHGVWSQVDLNHVTYLESCAHSITFHFNDGHTITATASFKDYERNLSLRNNFVRCHKSYIVNLDYVKNWEMGELTLEDGSIVKISRPYWHEMRKNYACRVAQSQPSEPLLRSTGTPCEEKPS